MRLLLFILFFIPLISQAQYYPESLSKWEANITELTQWPDADQISTFKKASIYLVKAEIPRFDAKRAQKKSGHVYKEAYDQEKAFSQRYNNALDSIISKLYPFKDRVRVKSAKSFASAIKDKKARPFAYVQPSGDRLLYFGMSNERKAFYAIPIPEEMLSDSANIAAEFQFIFQRLENFFKRMELGPRSSVKVYKDCKAKLNERINKDRGDKVLLINEKYLAEGIEKKELGEWLEVEYKLVSDQEINEVILSKSPGVWYLKIIPYEAFDRRRRPGIDGDRSNDFGSIQMIKEDRRFEQGAHYIIDPTDGAALFVNFAMDAEVNMEALKRYGSELKESSLSLR